jgi:NAD(P)-dependent dehydrogenase (short-subunit alcohol dehydrogenase family)
MAEPAPDLTLRGKTCLVTGANRGIGRATAQGLAGRGARVLLVSRDAAAGAEAAGAIRSATGNQAVEALAADLASQAAIRSLASEVLSRCPRLDVLINSAGLVTPKRTLTVDGIETVFAVNHLAYFLLTNLLLDRLKASAPSRIVNLASEAHQGQRLDFDNLQLERGWRPVKAYALAKLGNVMFTYELARRLAGTGVTANCLHPGVIATKLLLQYLPLPAISQPLTRAFAGTPEQGAETPLYLATSPDVEGVTGTYFARCKPKRSTEFSYDEAAGRRLWDESARLTGL